MLRNRLALAAALVLGMGAAGTMTQPAPIVRAEAPQTRRETKRTGRKSATRFQFGYMTHGPTAAQMQRAAKKARNVRRHKQHVRGRA